MTSTVPSAWWRRSPPLNVVVTVVMMPIAFVVDRQHEALRVTLFIRGVSSPGLSATTTLVEAGENSAGAAPIERAPRSQLNEFDGRSRQPPDAESIRQQIQQLRREWHLQPIEQVIGAPARARYSRHGRSIVSNHRRGDDPSSGFEAGVPAD
jgi:hypothetical protein